MNAALVPEQNATVKQPVQKADSVESSTGQYIYSIFHIIMSLIAIYLSFRCNKGFEIGPFLIACCCPYIYIIYILATRGTCGIFEKNTQN